MSVIVYSKPSCVQCNFTKRTLNKLGVEFEEIDISENKEGRERVAELGFVQVPVVDFNGEVFSGYRPEKLEKLSKSLSKEAVKV